MHSLVNVRQDCFFAHNCRPFLSALQTLRKVTYLFFDVNLKTGQWVLRGFLGGQGSDGTEIVSSETL